MERFSGLFSPFTLMETLHTGSVLPVGMTATGGGRREKRKKGGEGRQGRVQRLKSERMDKEEVIL